MHAKRVIFDHSNWTNPVAREGTGSSMENSLFGEIASQSTTVQRKGVWKSKGFEKAFTGMRGFVSVLSLCSPWFFAPCFGGMQTRALAAVVFRVELVIRMESRFAC